MNNLFMKGIYKTGTLITLLTMLTACHLTPHQAEQLKQSEAISYSSYYLWLKSLSSAELLIEVKQNLKLLSSTIDEIKKQQLESKLMLIYSLPNPNVYQPYTAKALLNKYPLPNNVNNETDANLAFMVMLRDQLNSQLHLLSKQVKMKANFLDEKAKQNTEILRLKKQLSQLKAIEKSITGHSLVNDQ